MDFLASRLQCEGTGGAEQRATPQLRGAKAKRDQQHPSPAPSQPQGTKGCGTARAVPATQPQLQSLGEIPSGLCPNVNPDQGLTFYITLNQYMRGFVLFFFFKSE